MMRTHHATSKHADKTWIFIVIYLHCMCITVCHIYGQNFTHARDKVDIPADNT